jgi:ribonuclease P protein component
VRVHSSAFTIIAFPGEGEAAVARLGCAISRRVGNAVVRNRIRRLLKEIFRRRAKELPAVDFVVVAKPSAKTLADDGFESVQREFSEGLMNAVDRLARSEQKRRAPRERSDEPRGES